MSDRIEAEILDVLGEEVAAAVDTPLVVIEGPKGDPGKDGITPTIGDNGNWFLGTTDTGKPSRGATGAPGKDGHSPVVTATKSGKTTTISVDGAAIATVEDGAAGKPGAAGADGITPTIGANGHWYLGTEDTGKPSRGATGAKGDAGATGPVGPAGPVGAPGKDGHSPVVTATKSGKTTTISVDGAAIATVEDGADGSPVNWRGAWEEDTEYSKLDAVSYDGSSYIFTSDTHVIGSIPGVDEEWGLMAQNGNDGANGVTPHIGDNGHWYIGSTDTGKPSRGETGSQGTPGIYYGTTPPTGDTHPVWIDPDGGPDDGGLLPAVTAADNGKVLRVVNSEWAAEDIPAGGTGMGITGAAVGQIAKITAVDASGVPTEWSPVDMPSGGGGETWEEIKVITLADAVNTVTINTDSGGNSISLKKVRILIEGSATAQLDLFFNNSRYMRAQVVGTAASVGALSAEPFCGKMYCFAVTNIIANYASAAQPATIFSGEIKITEIKIIVNNSGTFSAGTKFTIQGVRA